MWSWSFGQGIDFSINPQTPPQLKRPVRICIKYFSAIQHCFQQSNRFLQNTKKCFYPPSGLLNILQSLGAILVWSPWPGGKLRPKLCPPPTSLQIKIGCWGCLQKLARNSGFKTSPHHRRGIAYLTRRRRKLEDNLWKHWAPRTGPAMCRCLGI